MSHSPAACTQFAIKLGKYDIPSHVEYDLAATESDVPAPSAPSPLHTLTKCHQPLGMNSISPGLIITSKYFAPDSRGNVFFSAMVIFKGLPENRLKRVPYSFKF